MTSANSQLYSEIDALSATDKLMLVEWILKSLYQPDLEIDKLWADEAEKRLDAYEREINVV